MILKSQKMSTKYALLSLYFLRFVVDICSWFSTLIRQFTCGEIMYLKRTELDEMWIDNVFAFYHKGVREHDYFSNADRNATYDCRAIATDLAITLINENYELCMDADQGPQILEILDLENHQLIPKQLSWITWQAHYVCQFQWKAYDPLLPAPIPIEEYDATVFGNPQRKNKHIWTSELFRLYF